MGVAQSGWFARVFGYRVRAFHPPSKWRARRKVPENANRDGPQFRRSGAFDKGSERRFINDAEDTRARPVQDAFINDTHTPWVSPRRFRTGK